MYEKTFDKDRETARTALVVSGGIHGQFPVPGLGPEFWAPENPKNPTAKSAVICLHEST